MSKRLRNFLKQMENEFDDPTAEELAYINEEVKRYLVNGTIPQDRRAKQLAYKLAKGIKDTLSNRTLPTMPHEQWMAENKTRCQPLEWVPSPDWKPTTHGPVTRGNGNLHIVKKGEE